MDRDMLERSAAKYEAATSLALRTCSNVPHNAAESWRLSAQQPFSVSEACFAGCVIVHVPGRVAAR
jgi:hypothetical protein